MLRLGIVCTAALFLLSVAPLPCHAFPSKSSHTLSRYHKGTHSDSPFAHSDREALYKVLSSITHDLVGDDEIAFLGFSPTFRIIDSPWPNAFARGRTEIVFTSALIDSFQSRSEIAFVIAHELGHLILGHTQHALPGRDLALVAKEQSYESREMEADCYAHQLLKGSPFQSSRDGAKLMARIADSGASQGTTSHSRYPTVSARLSHLSRISNSEGSSCRSQYQ